MTPWLVISASPRAGGNCDDASELVSLSLRQGGALVERIQLRDYIIAPCVSCGLCVSAHGECALDEYFTGRPDHAAELFTRMRDASGLVFVSPVYFYGVPALFKALIDRSQRYWASANGDDLPLKPAYALMLAARMRGERLFDGSLLTLRHFLRMLDFSLKGHFPVRGVDEPGAFMALPHLPEQVGEWAMELLQSSG